MQGGATGGGAAAGAGAAVTTVVVGAGWLAAATATPVTIAPATNPAAASLLSQFEQLEQPLLEYELELEYVELTDC